MQAPTSSHRTAIKPILQYICIIRTDSLSLYSNSCLDLHAYYDADLQQVRVFILAPILSHTVLRNNTSFLALQQKPNIEASQSLVWSLFGSNACFMIHYLG